MLRSKYISEEQPKIFKKLDLSTEEGRQLALITTLSDINFTLAMLLDVYSITHGIDMNKEKSDN